MPRKADKTLEGRIVDAAYQLWRKGGEHALTMRGVAKAARTTTPTLYERFKDKHDLIAFLRERARQRMFEAVQPGKSANEACQLGLRFAISNGNEYLLLSADWAARVGRKEHLPSFEFLKARLAGDVGGTPAENTGLAMSLVALVHGTALLLLGEGVEKRVSAAFRKACLAGCRALMERARDEHTGQARNASVATG